MKTCTRCHVSKDESEFWHKEGKLRSDCKACTKAARRIYCQTPRYKQLKRISWVNYYLRYPEKQKAHKAIANGVRHGTIVKPDRCSNCGQFAQRIHAHHPNYENKRDVVYLCPQCHSDVHRLHSVPLKAEQFLRETE